MSSITRRLLDLAEGEVVLAPGASLFLTGDPVRNLYVVREGTVRLVRHQASGGAVVLQRAQADQLLAEASLFASRYHREVQQARARAELLSLRTVRERLEGWRALHGELPPRGRWVEVAQEIGVSPEALYRELARGPGA